MAWEITFGNQTWFAGKSPSSIMFPAKKTSICSGMSQPWGDRRVNQQYWWPFPSRKTCCFFVQAAGVKSEHRITMPFTVIKRSISVGFLASGWSLTGEFRVRHLRPIELIQRFWVAERVHTQTRYLMRFFNADFHATCSAFTGGCARHGDVSVPTESSAIERHTSHHPCILVKPQKPAWSAVLHWWEGQVQDGLTVFFLTNLFFRTVAGTYGSRNFPRQPQSQTIYTVRASTSVRKKRVPVNVFQSTSFFCW